MKKLNSSHKIQKGTVLRIYKKGFGYSRLQVFESNDLYLSTFAFDSDFLANIKHGDQIDIYIWIENVASYEFKTNIAGFIPAGIISDHGFIFIKHSNTINITKNRKCLKAAVNVPLKFFIFDTDHIEKNFETEEIIFHEGTIIELCDREAVVKCNEVIKEGSFLYGHLSIDAQNLEIIGRIENIAGNTDNTLIIKYPGLSEKDRGKILDYIFEVYRE